MTELDQLVEDIIGGNHAALARGISFLENRRDGYRELASMLYAHGGNAQIVGITGSPGAGKSTIVDQLISQYRAQELTVGVLAIDPTSPFSGGSILGDRIRMGRGRGDEGVFVRSMSTRGMLGGLTPAITDAIAALKAFGIDRILIETVGTGQSEIDIVRIADTVCVILQPATGDDVQMLKAGIMEIADIYVVNKADLSGVDRTVQRLKEQQKVARASDTWDPPIVETVATSGHGIDDLITHVNAHYSWAESSGELDSLQRQRFTETVRRILHTHLEDRIDRQLEDDHAFADELQSDSDPYEFADAIMNHLLDEHSETGQYRDKQQ